MTYEGSSQYKRLAFNPWGQEGFMEKEMVTSCSILVQEISWTEEPGVLQSMGLQKSQM